MAVKKKKRLKFRNPLYFADRSGEEASRIGKETEERVLGIFEYYKSEWPDYILGAEHGTKEDDENGIDIWVITDTGRLPLQIKTGKCSLDRRQKYEERGIEVIVAQPTKKDRDIFNQLNKTIKRMRKTILEDDK